MEVWDGDNFKCPIREKIKTYIKKTWPGIISTHCERNLHAKQIIIKEN